MLNKKLNTMIIVSKNIHDRLRMLKNKTINKNGCGKYAQ